WRAVMKQHVIAKQIRMNHAARQIVVPMPCLEANLLSEQIGLFRAQERIDLRCRVAPPRRTTQIVELAAVGLPRKMHFRQNFTHTRTLTWRGVRHRLSLEASHDGGGFAVQLRQKLILQIRDRLRAWNSMTGQMRHQVEVKGQLARLELLEQRQHEPSV